ncbi:MAG: hypothetical protein HY219_01045 [Candidatus Staskawiczbacteria bacterium]|nr:hypothetical protein [Candidatus Staskawiczbacteria bacterium]
MKYTLNYKPEMKPETKSFFVKNDNKIVAICPLILEDNNGVKEFSFGNNFGPAPAFSDFLTSKLKDKVAKLIFKHIDKLAKDFQVKRARLKFSILNKSFIEASECEFNYLMKFGYLDVSLNTQVIDLSQTLDELRNSLRHGHDSDVDKAAKEMTVEFFDENNIFPEMFNNYIELHHKAAGRVTRPRSTFDLMYDLIKEGKAFLVGAKKDNVFAGFSYFFLFKNNVYYGSSCNNPDVEDLPIAHFIQWKTIEYMNKKKNKFYEIGWQNFSDTLSDFPSQKEIDIARFKRGFGGQTVPLFMGEKYYDKDFFLKVYQDRITRYADSIKN